MRIWDPYLTERDRIVFGLSGYGRTAGFGKRPAIMVVDTNYAFVGDRREPIEESVKRWRNSCGEDGWNAVDRIAELIAAGRRQGLPIIYSTSDEKRKDGWDAGRWKDKNARRGEDISPEKAMGGTIVPPIAPLDGDIVIRKKKPSAFFGTMLIGYLVDLQADSLLVCGGTTSGCVRGTVLDAFSYNLKVAVVEEATFDRGQVSHAINLFDLNLKYADVVSVAETIAFIETLPIGLFDERMPILRTIREAVAREAVPAGAGARA